MAEIVYKSYAGALFDAAFDSGELEDVKKELSFLDTAFRENPEFLKILRSKSVSKDYRKEMLKNVFENGLSTYNFNFLKILIDNERIGHFYDICNKFKSIYNEHFGIVEIIAVTAVPLEAEARSRLEKKLSENMGKRVIITNEVDEKVIGGVKLISGNSEVDVTVGAKLRDLKASLSAAYI